MCAKNVFGKWYDVWNTLVLCSYMPALAVN